MAESTSKAVLDELDARIAAASILGHPFYRRWNAGTLTRQDLATYARVYFPHVAAFPEYLEVAAERAEQPMVRAELLENLREERTVPQPHAELWLRFAAAVGADPAAVRAATPADAARRTVSQFRHLCGGATTTALAALYAYESQQPEVSRQKMAGLREHYGFTDVEALAYFTVHAEADQRHGAGERRALALYLEAGACDHEVIAACQAALGAYWDLLDGVTKEIAATATAC
jgi:pyrroloquinoline-quinone synthase